MKLIEHGPPIERDPEWKDYYFFLQPTEKEKFNMLEDSVTYLSEHKAVMDTKQKVVRHYITILGKKSNYMCSDCGTNFISHKGMCTSCYVRQL